MTRAAPTSGTRVRQLAMEAQAISTRATTLSEAKWGNGSVNPPASVRLLQRKDSTSGDKLAEPHCGHRWQVQIPMRGGHQMRPAIEISFALWGMIGCAALEAGQFLF
jgi:hypothetical protein